MKIIYWSKNVFRHYNNRYLFLLNPNSYKGTLIVDKKYETLINQIDNKTPFDKMKIEGIDAKDGIVLLHLLSKYHLITYRESTINKVYLNPKFEKQLAVWVHITNQCNFRCTYCFVSKTPQTIPVELAKKSIYSLILSAKNDEMKAVNLKYAGGEPLLELAKVVEVSTYAKKVAAEIGIRVTFSVTTNAALLTEKTCKILQENGIHAHISIDGIGKYHDKNRPFVNQMGTYVYVQKGVDMAYKYKILSNFLVTVTRTNVNHLPDFAGYLMEHYPRIPVQLNFYKNHTKQDGLLMPKQEDLITAVRKVYEKVYKFYAKDKLVDPSRQFLLDGIQFYLPSMFHCGAGKNYVTLDYDGTYKVCPVVHKKIKIPERADTLSIIKKNISFLGNDKPISKMSICVNCQWVVMCKGGCKAHKYYLGMNTLMPSPYCHTYKTLIPLLAKLEGRHKLSRLLS